MKKLIRGIWKWFSRILLGIISLVILVFAAFYILRGTITSKVVEYINEQQPGEVSLEKMYLRPFMSLPDVSVRIQGVEYLEHKSGAMADSIPVFRLEEVFVSLDIIELFRGKYKISQVRFGDGELNYLVGADSVSNVERALGIRFGDQPETTDSTTQPVILDLENLEVRNLTVHYSDQTTGHDIDLVMNGLRSTIAYDPEQISATVMFHSEVMSANFGEMNIGQPRTISFSSSVNYDLVQQMISLERSTMDIADAIFEMNGQVNMRESELDIAFSVTNTGIELLNFLFNGVLDLDAIEQIDKGGMILTGTASGSYKNKLPLIRMDVSASGLGFRVHSIGQSVTDIGFEGSFTNGSKPDLSQAAVELKDFHVKFPEGFLDAQIAFSNMTRPSVSIAWNGNAELSLINEIIDSKTIRNMKGDLRLDGEINGVIDKSKGEFLENGGELSVYMNNVAVSLPENEIEDFNGELYLKGAHVGFRNTNLVLDENRIALDARISNALPYLMGFSVTPGARIRFQSDRLALEKIIGDTLFDGPVTDVDLWMSITTGKDGFKKLMQEHIEIPALQISMQKFSARIPGYAPLNRIRGEFNVDSTRIAFSRFRGTIGQSNFDIEGAIENYLALVKKDSSAKLYADLRIRSDRLRAMDFMTTNGNTAPSSSQLTKEEIRDLLFNVNVETKVYEVIKSNGLPNVNIQSDQLQFYLKYYPQPFRDFNFDIENTDTSLLLNKFAGHIGESNFDFRAKIYHLFDSSGTLSGEVNIASELLDIDDLLSYELLSGGEQDSILQTSADTTGGGSAGLENIEYPDLALNLDVGALRYQGNTLNNMLGTLTMKPYKIIYFDEFSVQSETGGIFKLNGQFNVSSPEHYVLSADLEIDTVNMSDFDLQIAVGDSIYSLEENFNGILSAEGMAEFFFNPDLSLNIESSTAMFYVTLEQGRVKNFAPLQALAKYTDTRELNDLKFGKLTNPRGFTLSDGKMLIPLMSIESSVGLLLLEGEQRLNGDFLYLVRAPWDLVKGTAWNLLTSPQKDEGDEEIHEMKTQKFMPVTIFSKDGVTEVKLRDRRDQFSLQ